MQSESAPFYVYLSQVHGMGLEFRAAFNELMPCVSNVGPEVPVHPPHLSVSHRSGMGLSG